MTQVYPFLAVLLLLFTTLNTSAQPELFLPEVFPTDEAFGLALSPDENELFFVHSHGGRDSLRLMYAVKRNGQWMKPVPSPFIKGKFNVIDPAFTPNGKTLLYNSNQPLKDGRKRNYDIYAVDKTKYGWGEPYVLNDVINSDSSDIYATQSRRGTLFFVSRRGDFRRSNEIYYSEREKGGYKKVVALDSAINSRFSDSNPFISPNEDYLIFFSSKPGGAGASDLYISFKHKGKWLKGISLGPLVNTKQGEFCPLVDARGEYLYFSRNRNENKRIYENIYRIPLKDLKLKELKEQALLVVK